MVKPQVGEAVVLAPRVGFTEPWRFVTSMFGHALSIFHIGFNMYALWALGRSLEPSSDAPGSSLLTSCLAWVVGRCSA
ncbi:rhomboid family serine protease [Cutibacterium acnes JCM 18909]|nr:rhomboid family serine protease [Cutibacterium acnes JCM 18909]